MQMVGSLRNSVDTVFVPLTDNGDGGEHLAFRAAGNGSHHPCGCPEHGPLRPPGLSLLTLATSAMT